MTTWIFQGNPTVFKLNEYIQTRKNILWTIRQKHYKDEILSGDDVYIWRSDGNHPKSGGIIAKGNIKSSPQEIEDDAPELWIKPQEATIALRVKIELKSIRLSEKEGMLKRVDLEKDPVLRNMRILVFRSETNYKLESIHAQNIGQLWDKKKEK